MSDISDEKLKKNDSIQNSSNDDADSDPKLTAPLGIDSRAEGTDQSLNLIKSSLENYWINVGEKKISLLDAVEKMKNSMADGVFCPQKIGTEYKDIIDGILDGGLLAPSVGYSLNQICTVILSGMPSNGKRKVTIGKLKRLFKISARRRQFVPCDPECLQDLSAKISSSAKELEPGENIDQLWNEEIACAFSAVIISQYKFMSKLLNHDDEKIRTDRFKKFVEMLSKRKRLWPKGTMNSGFLQSKAAQLLENHLKSENVTFQSASIYCPQTLSKQERTKMKHYIDLDRPGKSDVDNITLSKSVKTAPSGSPNSIQSSNLKMSTDIAGGRNLEQNSRQRKRYSDESLHDSDRSPIRCKRKKLQSSQMTDFDKKLQSFKVWDPLVKVTEKKMLDVFKTKEETDKIIAGVSQTNDNIEQTAEHCSSLNDESNGPSHKSSVNLPEEHQKPIGLSSPFTLEHKAEVLKENYGEMSVVSEKNDSDGVTVVIDIQGYVFEGTAKTQEDAVEDAACKALLLAPFIFQQT